MDLEKLVLTLFIVFLVLDVATVTYSIVAGPYPEEPVLAARFDPTSYKILYVHVPLAWNTYVAFTLTLIGSVLFLVKGRVKYDVLALTSSILGIVYGVAALTTGMLWAHEVWGEAWSWDPRETSTLILILAYIGYLALRASIPDVERARVLASSYGIAAYVTLPISYLSAVLVRSLHEQLPKHPLGPQAYMLLGVRVVFSFATFILLAYMYYLIVKSKTVSREVGE